MVCFLGRARTHVGVSVRGGGNLEGWRVRPLVGAAGIVRDGGQFDHQGNGVVSRRVINNLMRYRLFLRRR